MAGACQRLKQQLDGVNVPKLYTHAHPATKLTKWLSRKAHKRARTGPEGTCHSRNLGVRGGPEALVAADNRSAKMTEGENEAGACPEVSVDWCNLPYVNNWLSLTG